MRLFRAVFRSTQLSLLLAAAVGLSGCGRTSTGLEVIGPTGPPDGASAEDALADGALADRARGAGGDAGDAGGTGGGNPSDGGADRASAETGGGDTGTGGAPADARTGLDGGPTCADGACVSNACRTTADCGGALLCDPGTLTCVACGTDAQCLSAHGPAQLCLAGRCTAGDCRTSADCTGGALCDGASHLCAACASDKSCKGDSAYGSTTICIGGACTAGDCHDTSNDCTAGQLCGVSAPHTCGACGGDAPCTADARYGAGNICVQGNCQLGDCHASSADCRGPSAGLICGAASPNNCGACASDGQCQTDAAYGGATLCATGAGANQGKCVTAACAVNHAPCPANDADFCCGSLCVSGNCCNESDCANNPSFGVGFACVSNDCTQCAPASGNKYYVDPVNGNDQTATGSGLAGGNPTPACRFRTLTRAMAVIGNFAAPSTRVILVGAASGVTGLDAGEALPVTLPPNVVITTQGGPITISLPAAISQANPTNTSGFVLSSNASGLSGDPSAPLVLDGNGNRSGIAVSVSGAGNAYTLSNLTIQNTRGHGISVTSGTLNVGAGLTVRGAGTAAIARDGLIVGGTVAGGAVTAAGVANIHVAAGQAPTLFSACSSHGIEVTTGGSVNVTGVAASPLPSNGGTVVTSYNTTAGLRIDQTPGTTGLAVSSIDGLVSWGNTNYGARLFAGSKIKVRNSVFGGNAVDGVLIGNVNNTAAGLDVSAIDLGSAADPGHNWLQVPLGVSGNNPTAGLCVNLGANTAGGTLRAAGNQLVTGAAPGTEIDCATAAATVTRGACANQNSLGLAKNTIVTVVLGLCM
jgi:hypothetical protein